MKDYYISMNQKSEAEEKYLELTKIIWQTVLKKPKKAVQKVDSTEIVEGEGAEP